jgi:polyisoprenyl-phosphate glycosyltransferase
MLLSIIVPCYNEEKNIPLILEKFKTVVNRPDIEVVLVDNGSKDGSAKTLQQLLPNYPFARSVKVEINQGYGFGILTGLKAAKGNFIGWTHADMQTDPGDVIKAFNIIAAEGYPPTMYVKGERQGRSIFDNIFTYGMSFYESIYLGQKLWDINAQPNIFHKSFFAKWDNPPHDFSLDLYALYMAQKLKLRVERFPVIFPRRVHGASSWNTGFAAKWKFIKRTVEFSGKLKQRLG